MQRFFSNEIGDAKEVSLPPEESHHFVHVLRGGVGQAVILFDGSGSEFFGEVIRIRKGQVDVSITRREQVDREPEVRVELAVAIPKGDRQRFLVEKLTELGVVRLTPLVATRSVAQPTEAARARWRSYSIAACKQSGRTKLLEFGEPVDVERLVQMDFGKTDRLFADVDAGAERTAASLVGSQKLVVAIGPEGGFTPAENNFFCERGWDPFSLGPRILRVETAAVAVASIVIIGGGGT